MCTKINKNNNLSNNVFCVEFSPCGKKKNLTNDLEDFEP